MPRAEAPLNLRTDGPRAARLLVLVLAVWSLACTAAPLAFAAEQNEATTRNIVIASTIAVALLIGLILYQFSIRSSRGRYAGGPMTAEPSAGPAPEEPQSALPAILQEISRLPGPAHKQQQVARAVSELVTTAVEERLSSVKRDLGQRMDRMAEEHRRSEAVLERKYQQTLSERKQTSAVLESIAEGLVVVNQKGEVVMMNPAAEKLLGVRQQERVGQRLTEGLKDEQLVSMVHSSERGEREIVVSAKQDSTKKVLRASNAMITDENGGTIGMVAVLSDVTKQREIEEMKSEFLSKVSHELRTPIVAMRHALAILIDQIAGPLSEEQQKFLEISQRNLDRLNQLINDLLDLSKLEAKKMELRPAAVSIAQVITSTCEAMGPWAGSKGISIDVRASAGIPEITADGQRVGQVVTNLLGNAIKFTPQGGRVAVAVQATPDGTGVQVAVEDTGVGIAKEDLPKLFSKFQQVGERSASDITGTGLGLAISKEIVELHGGRIWAESDAGKGARFIFVLPLQAQPPAAA